MSEATCFNCGKILGVGKSMEELLKIRLPVFCGLNCSTTFPDNHTPEFEVKLIELKEKLTQMANNQKK